MITNEQDEKGWILFRRENNLSLTSNLLTQSEIRGRWPLSLGVWGIWGPQGVKSQIETEKLGILQGDSRIVYRNLTIIVSLYNLFT